MTQASLPKPQPKLRTAKRHIPAVLRELLGFPQLSQYGRDSAAALLTMLPMLLQDSAAQGLSRIWDGLRYRDYAERQKLDGGKYEILCLLARQETGLDGLCRRLDELQALVCLTLARGLLPG